VKNGSSRGQNQLRPQLSYVRRIVSKATRKASIVRPLSKASRPILATNVQPPQFNNATKPPLHLEAFGLVPQLTQKRGAMLDCGRRAPHHLNLYGGTSLIRNRLSPWDPPKTLGIGLRKGPRGVRFLDSVVPLYSACTPTRQKSFARPCSTSRF